MGNQEIRLKIAKVLREDAAYQNAGTIEAMGKTYDDLDVLKSKATPDVGIQVAWMFYDCWIDERNHHFSGMHRGMSREDWPKVAIHIAEFLEGKTRDLDPKIHERFHPK